MRVKIRSEEELIEYAKMLKIIYEDYGHVKEKLVAVTNDYELSEKIANVTFKE